MITDVRRLLPDQAIFIISATVALFLVSPWLAAGSLSSSALLTVFGFAAILAIAAIGQTLVIQQGGLDLSTPGAISLAAVLVSQFPGGSNVSLWLWLPAALGAGALGGALSGFAITRFGVTPLVSTLSLNALYYGTVLFLSAGNTTAAVPGALSEITLSRFSGIPVIAIFALVVIAVVEFVMRATIVGRRFLATGTSPRAARAAGIKVRRYVLMTYVVAGFFSALSGVLLAGYIRVPSLFVGQDYLLPVIAVVVLGGTPVTGGAGSVVASGFGAIFFIQLKQIVFGMGASQAAQFIVQALIILLGMAVMLVPWRRILASAWFRGGVVIGRRKTSKEGLGKARRETPQQASFSEHRDKTEEL